MKRSLIIVVVLLAMASLMAAMAYNTATVTNAAELKVANTQTALLALNPHAGVGNKDQTAYIDNGNLMFKFCRGNNPSFGGDQNYGLQKNSTYMWWQNGASNTGMFSIQNRSAETVELTIQATNIPSGVEIYVNQSIGDGGNGWQPLSGGKVTLPRQLGSGNTCDIGVKIVVGPNASFNATTAMEMIIGSTAK